jgi:hypothetical protein
MNNKQEIRIRQGKGPYIFEKDWEKGHDPLKPYIKSKDADGNVTKKTPIGKCYNVCGMKEGNLGDLLGE